MNLRHQAEELSEYIIACRHHIHRHAELSYQERETTAFIVSELKKHGIPVQTFDDYTGCIATIQGESSKQTVLLRADIDALPIQEKSGVPFTNQNEGVMHACGHDCHAAMLMGAAILLWQNRKELKGTVKLLFQAAEEAFIGSHYYVEKGLLKDVNAAMGMHIWPTLPTGKLCIVDGPLMASCDNFRLTIHGVSTHGSQPQNGKDAIVAASAVIAMLQTIVSRSVDPTEMLVISIGKINAGTQFNIIADTAVMEGTVRTYAKEVRDTVEQKIRNIMDSTAAALGCTAELEYSYIEPPLVNRDTVLNEIARKAARKLYGEDILSECPPSTGSEDFSYIMEHIPSSLFIFMGMYDEKAGCIYPVHNERFQVKDDILKIGAGLYAQFAAEYLCDDKGEDI